MPTTRKSCVDWGVIIAVNFAVALLLVVGAISAQCDFDRLSLVEEPTPAAAAIKFEDGTRGRITIKAGDETVVVHFIVERQSSNGRAVAPVRGNTEPSTHKQSGSTDQPGLAPFDLGDERGA